MKWYGKVLIKILCNLGPLWLILLDTIASRSFWSVSNMKWLAYRIWWNFSIAQATASDSNSIAMYLHCAPVNHTTLKQQRILLICLQMPVLCLVCNCKKGYWHQELDEASSFLTTFNTELERFRYTLMPFGSTVAGDVFQHKLDQCFGNLKNVIVIADDIMIVGKKPSHSDHDQALTTFLETARKYNVWLNSIFCLQHILVFLLVEDMCLNL